MESRCAILFVALCCATATATIIGPLETDVQIGDISKKTPGDTPAEKQAAANVIGLLEYLRNMMTVGIDLIVPILEPYKQAVLPPVVLDGKHGPIDGTVNVHNLVASGAQNFSVNDIKVAFEDKRLDFNLSVPVVEVDVDYEGNHLVYEHFFEFSTSGHVHITLVSLDILGSFCVKPLLGVADPAYYVSAISVHNKVKDVEVDKGGPIPAAIVNEVKDALMESVAQAAKDELSKILKHFTRKQVDKFLKG